MITREDIEGLDFGREVDMDDYQRQARKFAIYDKSYKVVYPTLGLSSEVGEVSDKLKKWLRDGHAEKEDLAKELGDVLWYVAILAEDLGFTLSDVAIMNLEKLDSRKKRGKLRGSGDNR